MKNSRNLTKVRLMQRFRKIRNWNVIKPTKKQIELVLGEPMQETSGYVSTPV